MSSEKASEFIERYTKDIEGKKSIDIISAFIELYARLKTAQQQIIELQEAMGYYAELNERVKKLEGEKKIEVVSENQAKLILNGK